MHPGHLTALISQLKLFDDISAKWNDIAASEMSSVLKAHSILSEADECESGSVYYVGFCMYRGSSEIKGQI